MHWSRLLKPWSYKQIQRQIYVLVVKSTATSLYELSLNPCFDLLRVSLASNKSQQHMNSQRTSEPGSAHWETVGLEPGQITISPHLLLSYYWLCPSRRVIITPGHVEATSHLHQTYRSAAKIIRGICQQNNTVSSFLFTIFCVTKWKEYISVTQRAGWEFIISLTIKILLQK